MLGAGDQQKWGVARLRARHTLNGCWSDGAALRNVLVDGLSKISHTHRCVRVTDSSLYSPQEICACWGPWKPALPDHLLHLTLQQLTLAENLFEDTGINKSTRDHEI